ncbi:energy transducer TonB [Novispirillum itersonii]|uniref:energy transducer TonB n=1 Tax=Novispirillum itersonii TaxID=189 RepID=UPI0003781B94|nr:energy transducer TonB [Novispirillum itersonii]
MAVAQAMATAQGFYGAAASGPLFGSGAGLPPLTCPLPGEARGRNPRITTATALLSVLVHAGAAVLLLRDPFPAQPDAAAPTSAAPVLTLTWEQPAPVPAPIPTPVTPSVAAPVDPVPPMPAEPESVVVPSVDPAPPVLSSVAAAAPAAVAVPAAVKATPLVPPLRQKPAVPRPAPRPHPAAPAAAMAEAPALAASAPTSAPVSTVSSASSVPSPVTPEPSLLRGEEGIPVSRDARYLEPPKPPEYPRRAVQLGLEGTVVVQALVEGGGVPRTVRIVTGSGVDSLDAAAVRAVSGWKFAVSDRGSLWVEIPVQFRLR